MKIALYETKKPFISKDPLIFMLVIIIMSVFFGTRQQWHEFYSYKSYNELFRNISAMEKQAAEDYLAENAERYQAYFELESNFDLSEGSKNFIDEYNKNRKNTVFTDSYFFEAALFRDVKEQYESVGSYSSHLQKVFDRAENMSSVSIFGNKSSYEMRNITATSNAYKKLVGVCPQFADTVGIKFLADFSPNDILLVAAAVFGAYFLVLKERKSGELRLAAVTKKGKTALGLSKVFAIFVWCVFSVLVIFGVRLTVTGAQYDLSAIFLPIQSVNGYLNCSYPVSAAEFIILSQAFRLFAAFICALLFSFAFMAAKHIYYICGAVALLAAEYSLFAFMDDFSIYGIFKYFNLFALLQFFDISETFRTINLFEQPINSAVIIFAFGLLMTIFLTVIFTMRFSESDLNYQGISLNRHRVKTPHISIFTGEAYRCLILNLGGAVLLALGFISVYGTVTDNIYYEAKDGYYERYLDKINSSEQAENIISEEEALFDGCRKKLADLSEDYGKGKITSAQYLMAVSSLKNELAREPALILLKEQKDYISQNPKANFVYYKKIEKYMNLKDREDVGIKSVLYMQLAIILIVCPIFLKFSAEENKLISATAGGGRKLLLMRFFMTSLIALAVFLCVHLPQIISFTSTVSQKDLSAAVQSLVPFREAKTDLSIGNYFILLYFIRFAAAEISALTAAALCTMIKNKAVGYIVCSCGLVLPEILYFLISKSFSEFGIVFFTEGNLFLRKIMLY